VLPVAVSAHGSVVVGSYRAPAGFYWMPTTRDIFIGGRGAADVSRDGRTISERQQIEIAAGAFVRF
jgi:hypothetical protein